MRHVVHGTYSTSHSLCIIGVGSSSHKSTHHVNIIQYNMATRLLLRQLVHNGGCLLNCMRVTLRQQTNQLRDGPVREVRIVLVEDRFRN